MIKVILKNRIGDSQNEVTISPKPKSSALLVFHCDELSEQYDWIEVVTTPSIALVASRPVGFGGNAATMHSVQLST